MGSVSVAVRFVGCNCTRGSLRCSPTIAAAAAKKFWDIVDILTAVEEWAARHAAIGTADKMRPK